MMLNHRIYFCILIDDDRQHGNQSAYNRRCDNQNRLMHNVGQGNEIAIAVATTAPI